MASSSSITHPAAHEAARLKNTPDVVSRTGQDVDSAESFDHSLEVELLRCLFPARALGLDCEVYACLVLFARARKVDDSDEV
jgi:hypothetical protein